MVDLVVSETQNTKLSCAQFHQLSEVPPEVEWFANIKNQNTRVAYQNDLREFSLFLGIRQPQDMRRVVRAHVIAWRKHLEARECSAKT